MTGPIGNVSDYVGQKQPPVGNVADYVGKTPGPVKTDPNDKKPGGDLGKDTFLKLLVAQLKYQDPSKPTDSSQFLAQTATFTMVEKITEMEKGQSDLLAAQQMLGANALIGRTVSYVDSDANEQSGLVTAATFAGGVPTVKVGDKDIALTAVKEVKQVNEPAKAAASGAPAA
jgi:flagellar basal-body rod modification protein FlgD